MSKFFTREQSLRVALWTALITLVALAAIGAPAHLAWAAPSSAQGVSLDTPSQKQVTPTPLKPGTYYIQSSLNGQLVLDISGASKKNAANAQIWQSNATAAQKWRVSVNTDGSYTLQCVASGKLLDVAGGKARNGNNVWQYTSNNTAAQKWIIQKSGNTYTIASAINRDYVLDVAGARAKKGTNVHVYKANGTAAQRWFFIPADTNISSAKTIENGLYEITFTKNTGFALDLSGASKKAGANIQIYGVNGTPAQKWIITRESDGFYSVRNFASGKPIDVSSGCVVAKANIQQWDNNNTDAQRWAIVKNKNGSYSFISKKSGMALDVAGGRAANKTNVQTYLPSYGTSQQFNLKESSPVSAGIYTIHSLISPSNFALDIKGASKNAGVAVQLYRTNKTLAQTFQLRKVSGSIFQIQSAVSGLYLQDAKGKVVQQRRSNGNKAQQWEASYERNGIAFVNVETGKRLAIAGGKASNGAVLVTAKAANANAQHFKLNATNLVADGYYIVENANKKVLDVAGASYNNSANIQLYTSNKTAAQKFDFVSAGSGYYRLLNDNSGKAVDVAGGSKAHGANVQQYSSNGTAAQLWKPELGIDGGIVLINKNSGMALDVNGTNVVQKTKTGAKSQTWNLIATASSGISGNAELDRYIKQVVNQNGRNLRSCFNWVVNNISWTNSVSGAVLPNGIISKQQTINFALYAFRNHRGDCYYHASIFKWLAIGCGYKAEARAGQVPSASQGLAAHGWTEVYTNGGTYVCDANLAQDIGGGYNWFMTTYSSAPVQYYL